MEPPPVRTFPFAHAAQSGVCPTQRFTRGPRDSMSIFDRFRLTGKRLFITGGSRGLGREMALAIADAGADVILVGRDGPSLEQTAADVRGLGREAWTIQEDVGIPERCEAA